ncbi:MBL fold metallo-hydrolase [Clostridium sp. WILCCON 0269]|uniref:MBL fold metallo-hydrolase n=1 Tax=Candidatus Clostridium eludens TaxID=3381663 RepID=A0ABW8SKH6_9CLOT
MLFKLGKTRKVTGNVYVVRTLVSNFFIYSDCSATVCFNTGFIPYVINRELKKININPEFVSNIFLTDPNFYNMPGIKLFKNADVYMPKDVFQKRSKHIKFSIRKKNKINCRKVEDGDIVNIGNIKIKAIAFPGHKNGAISYIVNDSILFI